jgi:ubiquinone/menaquinone biosynthesis C-methylase UbiE
VTTGDFHASVVAANQRVHSALADKYNSVEPHFRPENKAKVRTRIEQIAKMAPNNHCLVDLGCGTGFVIDLVKDLFDTVHGFDVTRSMLDQVDLSSGNVVLHECAVENLPLPNDSVDVVTAYSFLDHLADYRIVLKEAHRVLRPEGILYCDLVPNKYFWDAIYEASALNDPQTGMLVQREIGELVHHAEKLDRLYGISPSDWNLAEPSKSNSRGLDPHELLTELSEIGFEPSISYEWFLGEAQVLHGDSPAAADQISAHLREILPVSRQLFKYLVVTGAKK